MNPTPMVVIGEWTKATNLAEGERNHLILQALVDLALEQARLVELWTIYWKRAN